MKVTEVHINFAWSIRKDNRKGMAKGRRKGYADPKPPTTYNQPQGHFTHDREAYRPFATPAATTAGLTVDRSKERYGRGGSGRLFAAL